MSIIKITKKLILIYFKIKNILKTIHYFNTEQILTCISHCQFTGYDDLIAELSITFTVPCLELAAT